MSDQATYEELIRNFVSKAHEIAQKGLVNCSSGNLSYRLNESEIIISKTGSWLEKITNSEVSVINILSGEVKNGVAPSGEWKLHTAVYLKRADINVVLHCQSPCATSLACIARKPDYNAIIEVPLYIGEIPHLPFCMPGSDLLAKTVSEQPKESNVIQMSNHGQVVLGSTYDEAIERAVFFELCCNIIINTGKHYAPIPGSEIPTLKKYRKQDT
ncbi:MAG: class II aldolase/adducin family protein [Lentimicrobium sp.]|nr:class II aldolase/adducin family protein [Lentimicrobium sp.]